MSDFGLIKEKTTALSAEAASRGALLCAVIKNRTPEEIDFALGECGVLAVGENRVQELLFHYDTLKNYGADVHFIGSLQKNKVKYIADKVSMIESLDSLPLAAEVEKHACKIGRVIDVLVEVNIGREAQKGGVFPDEALTFAGELSHFPHLRVRGLMTIAPRCESIDGYDVYFSEMARLFDEFKKSYDQSDPPVLSMGMSESYKKALEYGATEIRIGTGIFGSRP